MGLILKQEKHMDIVAEMEGKPGTISAEIDTSDVLKVRKMIPSYKGTSIEKK